MKKLPHDVNLNDLTVVCLSANEGVERVELTEPRDVLVEAGATVVLAAPEPGQIASFDHLDRSTTFPVDRTVDQIDLDEVDAVLLPGGVANPDHLRTVPEAVQLVRAAMLAGLPIAAICHAPWTLVEADAVRGRMLTSWPSLRTDLVNAGAEWVDQEVVVCRNGPGPLITSRKPDDLPAFCSTVVGVLADAHSPASSGHGR